MCLSITFLITPKTLAIADTGNFMVPHFLNFYFQVFVLTYFVFFFVNIIICWHWHIDLRACFSHYISFIAFYFSISLDSKVLENSISFCLCYWFVLVFILFFTIQYSIVFTYFPLMYNNNNYYYYYYNALRVFHISVSRLSFTGHFSVFCTTFWWLYQELQLQLA